MRKYLAILFAIFLTSCATHYGISGFRGGYTEIKIDENTYDVSFKGNGYTSGEQIKRYFLYRCSEITLNQDCNYFIMFDKNIGSKTYSTTTRGSLNENGNFNAKTNNLTKSFGSGTIKILKEKPDEYDGIIYDAKELKNSLEPYIKRDDNSLF
jgi:hypothetical protein